MGRVDDANCAKGFITPSGCGVSLNVFGGFPWRPRETHSFVVSPCRRRQEVIIGYKAHLTNLFEQSGIENSQSDFKAAAVEQTRISPVTPNDCGRVLSL